MQNGFPAVGHRYLVDFQDFKVILDFALATSLTYTVLNPDGSSGQVETVSIKVESIRDLLFLVTWQESDKTTVVHIEDYQNSTIITNITNPDNSFNQFHGTFKEIDSSEHPQAFGAALATLTYSVDIKLLFRAGDIACMDPRGVELDNSAWMCTPTNAQKVYHALYAGFMPPDGAWSPDKVALFKQWMDQGCNP